MRRTTTIPCQQCDVDGAVVCAGEVCHLLLGIPLPQPQSQGQPIEIECPWWQKIISKNGWSKDGLWSLWIWNAKTRTSNTPREEVVSVGGIRARTRDSKTVYRIGSFVPQSFPHWSMWQKSIWFLLCLLDTSWNSFSNLDFKEPPFVQASVMLRIFINAILKIYSTRDEETKINISNE